MRKVCLLSIGFVFFLIAQVGATSLSLVSGSGSFTYDFTTAGNVASNAWTINETLTGNSPFLLRFLTDIGQAGSPLAPGTLDNTVHQNGKWFTKTVTNNTGISWTSFELEVQSQQGIASTDGDGLSFAQGSGLVFTSDKFSNYSRIDTTKDYLNFHNGIVNNGESVTFAFAISDNGPNNPFWLQETPNKAETPIPAAFWLLGSGLMGLFGLKRKIS
jgi:hypothetical protein